MQRFISRPANQISFSKPNRFDLDQSSIYGGPRIREWSQTFLTATRSNLGLLEF